MVKAKIGDMVVYTTKAGKEVRGRWVRDSAKRHVVDIGDGDLAYPPMGVLTLARVLKKENPKDAKKIREIRIKKKGDDIVMKAKGKRPRGPPLFKNEDMI
jgi:hypothetical protein